VARDGSELPAFAPVSDIPYRHEVRRYRGLLAVVPRLHDTFESLAGQYLGDSSKGWVIRDFNGLEAVTPYRALLIPTDPYLPGGLSEQGYRMVPVLVYHHLSRIKASRMSVPVTEFELQMAYLKRNRYQVISLEQLADFLEFKGQVPARSVVITFDDGWTSTYQYALPILKRYGFKATLVGSQRQALSWEQLQEIEESGVIDVQCHTKSHRNLNRQPEEDLPAYLKALEQELRDSRALLQRKIGKECRYLAYPYGATNHLVVALAEKFGYRAAFTVDRGPNPFFVTNFRVLRSMVYGDFDLKAFAANLATFGDQVLK
jgi:peptidoglycan/xylan/chitin deacetylase (PgdA/CDA1 family)